MTAVILTFAAISWLLWLIEHVGGRDIRDDLRKRLDDAQRPNADVVRLDERRRR